MGTATGARKTRAIFLDKDGTLIENLPYNVDPERIVLTPRAGEGLRLMQRLGYRLLVVSNQPGVALGRFDERALDAVWRRLHVLLWREGVRLAHCYYCPHHPQGAVDAYALDCDCRKPGPGLLLRAAADHGVDLARSWMIGDILHDVEAGARAGCRTVLIDNGNETEWALSPLRTPDALVVDLLEAAWLLESEELAPSAALPVASEHVYA